MSIELDKPISAERAKLQQFYRILRILGFIGLAVLLCGCGSDGEAATLPSPQAAPPESELLEDIFDSPDFQYLRDLTHSPDGIQPTRGSIPYLESEWLLVNLQWLCAYRNGCQTYKIPLGEYGFGYNSLSTTFGDLQVPIDGGYYWRVSSTTPVGDRTDVDPLVDGGGCGDDEVSLPVSINISGHGVYYQPPGEESRERVAELCMGYDSSE